MRRANKHNARRVTATVGGQTCKFDSQAEYRYALWLESERKSKRVLSWMHHTRPLGLHGAKDGLVARIAPDFLVESKDGSLAYHEVKGMPTAIWRLKRRLFEQEYPSTPYIVIDANHVGDVARGIPPRLFDDRKKKGKRKKAVKSSIAAKREAQ